MQKTVFRKPDIIAVNKKELYEIVKMAVYDVLSDLDFINAEELSQRELAFKEMERGETVKWDEYIKERGLYI